MPARKSGIYAIIHTASGRRYVGQASNIVNRWFTHRTMLFKGKHHCQYLQRAWLKYGHIAFEFKVLEHCSVSRANEREEVWMRFYRGGLFNSVKEGGKCARGFAMSREARAKMSAAALRVGADPEERRRRSERAKAQHAAGKLGRKTWKNPEETAAKLRAWCGSEGNKAALAKARRKGMGDSAEMSRRSYCRKKYRQQVDG